MRSFALLGLAGLGLLGCSGEGSDKDDGTAEACPTDPGTICNYAGTGTAGYNGPDLDRRESSLYFPMDIVFSPFGKPVLSDWNNHKLRLVEDDDTLRTIMGTDFIGDGDPDRVDSTSVGADGLIVALNHPTQQQYFEDGILLSASWHTHKLRVWDPATGIVHVWAGLTPDFVGDNGESIASARFNQPNAVLIDSNQDVFVVDMRNQRVRKITVTNSDDHTIAQGTITTVAGDAAPFPPGESGYCGDGGPGRQACFAFPMSYNPEPGGAIVLSPDETKLYVADTENHIIRVVDLATDRIDLYAGAGGEAGDVDGSLLDARFNMPRDLEMTPDGLMYVADSDNNKIRLIDTNTGEVTTFAGTGNPTCPGDGPQAAPRVCDEQATSGDGGPALEADLYRPFGVAMDLDGNLVVSDSFNHRIRTIYR